MMNFKKVLIILFSVISLVIMGCTGGESTSNNDVEDSNVEKVEDVTSNNEKHEEEDNELSEDIEQDNKQDIEQDIEEETSDAVEFSNSEILYVTVIDDIYTEVASSLKRFYEATGLLDEDLERSDNWKTDAMDEVEYLRSGISLLKEVNEEGIVSSRMNEHYDVMKIALANIIVGAETIIEGIDNDSHAKIEKGYHQIGEGVDYLSRAIEIMEDMSN